MKHISPLLTGFALFFLSLKSPAQSNEQGKEYRTFSLRTSLSSWAEYDAGIMLGINYRWHKNFSASLEPTWIFFSPFTNQGERISPSGVKIRADLRYHFPKKRKNSAEGFIAPEFHYKYTKTEKEDVFGINCQNGQCAYFQEAVYSQLKNELGALVKAGIIAPLGFISKKDRLFLELHLGLGAKQMKFRETDLPPGGSFVNPPFRGGLGINNGTDRNRFVVPILPLGFKLVLAI
ncbi:MAG: hypothetical protein ABIR30_14330 [Chitinophagaceae bacterium]